MVANPADVAKKVQERLNANGPHAARVRVLAGEVRPGTDGADWWWVPVSYQEDRNNAYVLYDVFSGIEEKLLSDEHLNVLLVPRVVRASEQ